MEIILALLFGAVIGILVHFLVRGRTLRGAAVAPLIATVAAGGAWTALTWLGFGVGDALLWLSPLIVAWIAWPVVAILSRSRRRHDQRERERLGLA